ncbi:MAG: hypothetical protein ACREN8_06885 [Candidatus Dormibacteraceae bacterium]
MSVVGRVRKVVVALALLGLLVGCGDLIPSPRPLPKSSANPVADAWQKCGATEMPPDAVRNVQLPKPLNLIGFPPLDDAKGQQAALAFERTSSLEIWALAHNQLAFLEGNCIEVPGSGAEKFSIALINEAMKKRGHTVFAPPGKDLTIAVKSIPASVADAEQKRTGVRPDTAIITITENAGIKIVDSHGKQLREVAPYRPGEQISLVTLGVVKSDGIGLRFWQTGDYHCSDAEVLGACNAVT